MPVTFQKMHGAGNDFVLLDLREQSLALDPERAASIANRHTGIGCDQLLVLHDSGSAIARFEVWNSDGSRAEQCGNGVRCIALYLNSRSEVDGEWFELEGPAGRISLQCQPGEQITVNMGTPQFEPAGIPVLLEPANGLYSLPINDSMIKFGAVSMGNPHAVIQVADCSQAPVAVIGPLLGQSEVFPRGCNVGFAEVIDESNILLRVHERGANETLACGSGACAAVAVLASLGKAGSTVSVKQAGGSLIIGWDGGKSPVMMTGPAVHVFEGRMS